MKNKGLLLGLCFLCGTLFADIVSRYVRYIIQFLNGEDFFSGMIFVFSEIFAEADSYMIFTLVVVLATFILSIIVKSISRIAKTVLIINFISGVAFILTTNFVGLPITYLPVYFVIAGVFLITEVISVIIMIYNLYKQFSTI